MLSIRLSRIGKKKQPHYRIIVTEKRRDPWGKHAEIIGSYNPRDKSLVVKEDRLKYWLKIGAQATATLNNLLINKEIIKGVKQKSWKKKVGQNVKKEDPGSQAAPQPPKSEEKPEEKRPEPKEELKKENKKE